MSAGYLSGKASSSTHRQPVHDTENLSPRQSVPTKAGSPLSFLSKDPYAKSSSLSSDAGNISVDSLSGVGNTSGSTRPSASSRPSIRRNSRRSSAIGPVRSAKKSRRVSYISGSPNASASSTTNEAQHRARPSRTLFSSLTSPALVSKRTSSAMAATPVIPSRPPSRASAASAPRFSSLTSPVLGSAGKAPVWR